MSEDPVAQPNSSPTVVEGEEEVKRDSNVIIHISNYILQEIKGDSIVEVKVADSTAVEELNLQNISEN